MPERAHCQATLECSERAPELCAGGADNPEPALAGGHESRPACPRSASSAAKVGSGSLTPRATSADAAFWEYARRNHTQPTGERITHPAGGGTSTQPGAGNTDRGPASRPNVGQRMPPALGSFGRRSQEPGNCGDERREQLTDRASDVGDPSRRAGAVHDGAGQQAEASDCETREDGEGNQGCHGMAVLRCRVLPGAVSLIQVRV